MSALDQKQTFCDHLLNVRFRGESRNLLRRFGLIALCGNTEITRFLGEADMFIESQKALWF